jgi:AsmA protein
LTGEADFHLTVAPPTLHLRAALVGATIEDSLVLGPMALLSGQLGGAVAITASGHSPAALLATLAGKANVAVQDGAISGFNLGELTDGLQHGATDSALASALTEGSTGFRQLEADASIQDGRIVLGDAHLQGAYGAADFSGAIDIAGRALDVQVTVQPEFPDAPRPGVRFTGPFEAVRRIPELTALAGWRAVLGANDTRPGDTKTGDVKP